MEQLAENGSSDIGAWNISASSPQTMPRIPALSGLGLDHSCVSRNHSFVVMMASQLLPLGRSYGCVTGLFPLTTSDRIDRQMCWFPDMGCHEGRQR